MTVEYRQMDANGSRQIALVLDCEQLWYLIVETISI